MTPPGPLVSPGLSSQMSIRRPHAPWQRGSSALSVSPRLGDRRRQLKRHAQLTATHRAEKPVTGHLDGDIRTRTDTVPARSLIIMMSDWGQDGLLAGDARNMACSRCASTLDMQSGWEGLALVPYLGADMIPGCRLQGSVGLCRRVGYIHRLEVSVGMGRENATADSAAEAGPAGR